MAFQEKSAWVMAAALTLGTAVYFGLVAMASSAAGALAAPVLPLIALYTIVLIVIAIAGHRSGYVLEAGVVVSLGVFLVSGSCAVLFYTVFASLMLGQLAEYAFRILLYRTSI